MTLHPILYWFGIYMAIGLVILVIARLLAALNRRAGPSISWVREMMEAIEVTNCGSSRWQQVAEKLLLPTLVWLFWPFATAIIMQSKSFAANRSYKPDPQAALSCTTRAGTGHGLTGMRTTMQHGRRGRSATGSW